MDFIIRGVRVRITIYFLGLITVLLILDRSGLIIYALMACLLHEAGHIAVMYLLGVKVEKLEFMPFGIKIEKSYKSLSYIGEAAILSAGPLVNIFLGIMFLKLSKSNFDVFASAAVVNFMIGAFNLLPIGLLDGGRLLSVFMFSSGAVSCVEKICFIVSIIFIIPLFVLAFYLCIHSKYNFTLMLTCIYMLIKIIKDYKNC